MCILAVFLSRLNCGYNSQLFPHVARDRDVERHRLHLEMHQSSPTLTHVVRSKLSHDALNFDSAATHDRLCKSASPGL